MTILPQATPSEEVRVRPVTRIALLDQVEDAFTSAPISRADLLAAAVASHARPEVIAVLHQLPDIAFRRAQDL